MIETEVSTDTLPPPSNGPDINIIKAENDDDNNNCNSSNPAQDANSILEEIKSLYTSIQQNEYRGGADGKIDMDSMPCECRFELGKDDADMACGDDSDCINRALFLECSLEECPCGEHCRNRRFTKREYPQIEVFKTEKKGYGLRTREPLKKSQFVIEYCGEVVPQSMFAKRAREYAQTGVKHFYFMSLKSDEAYAYKKGNIARFMNHSCAPNCELQKWVVNSRLRMGIFTLREIGANEELTFDYKFERYGSEPQICYCGHAACKGVIGGNKHASVKMTQDLGYFEEEGEDFDAQVRKTRRSASADNDDAEYTEASTISRERGLENPEHVPLFVKSLLTQCLKSLPITQWLRKLEATQSQPILRKFVQYHGLPVLRNCIMQNLSNEDVCLRIMRVLKSLPPMSRNSVLDSKIEDAISKLSLSETSEVSSFAKENPSPDPAKSDDDSKKRPSDLTSSSSDGNDRKRGKVLSMARSSSVGSYTAGNYDSPTDTNRQNGDRKPVTMENAKVWTYTAPPPKAVLTGFKASPRTYPYKDLMAASDMILPENWKAATTDDNKIYYYNQLTRQTQWEIPKAEDFKGKSSIVEGVSETDIEAIVEQANAAAQKNTNGVGTETALTEDEQRGLRAEVSEVVVKILSKYKESMSNEEFKKTARKLTHQIMDKEKKSSKPSKTITEEMRAKIKKFIKQSLGGSRHSELSSEGKSSNSKSSDSKSSKKKKK
ncbi:histone methyltransferase set2 [Blyttiomyces sp. JEL0837]|nr:histone methyltransferase set2 [Blyttiomyces sp. JEL0837]